MAQICKFSFQMKVREAQIDEILFDLQPIAMDQTRNARWRQYEISRMNERYVLHRMEQGQK